MTPSVSSNRHSGGTTFHLQIFHCLIKWGRKFYLSKELKLQMHTGSTHFSNVGTERLWPLTNEPVRAGHGGWLHAESIRPCFYNLTKTSLKRQPYEGLTASRRVLEEPYSGVEGLGHSPHPAQKYSTTISPLKRTQEQCLRHISEVVLHKKLFLIVSLWDGCVVSVLPPYLDTNPKEC